MIAYAVFCLIFVAWVASSGHADKPAREARRPPTVTKLAWKDYRLSDAEHLVLIDVPDRYVPKRCAVYVNEVTHTSHMSCNFDDAGSPFPQAEEEKTW